MTSSISTTEIPITIKSHPTEKLDSKMSKLSHYNNNNELDFEPDYESARPSPDIDQAGRESSLSSSDSAHSSSGLGSASDSNQCHSGRSSATGNESIIKINNLEQSCHSVTDWSTRLVECVRAKFNESQNGESFDQIDLEELAKPITQPKSGEQSLSYRWISRFIDARQYSASSSDGWPDSEVLEKVVQSLKDYLKFRRQFRLNDVRHDHFAREFHLLHGIFPFGRDKQNLPMMYLRARIHRQWSARLNESFQRYVAWQVDLITRSNHESKVENSVGPNMADKGGSFGICFDCLGVSYSCLDMEFLKFLVQLLVNKYPGYCKYALCLDLPWIFRSVWKIVRSWLPEEAQKAVQLVTAKELPQFIDEHQIPNSIKYNDTKASDKPTTNKHRQPDNIDTIPDISSFVEEFGIGSSELKQFKAHFDKVMKEYEQLGAV